MRRLQIKLAVFLFTLTLSWAQAEAARLPTFPRLTPYQKIRSSLFALGWSPAPGHKGKRPCDETRPDMCVPAWPEVEDCSGTGIGYCTTLWKHGDKVIAVLTAGVEPATYFRTECRANCR